MADLHLFHNHRNGVSMLDVVSTNREETKVIERKNNRLLVGSKVNLDQSELR